jgi:hypothetical protein
METHAANHPLYKHYQPPNEPNEKPEFSIFLAGSIEMNKAEKWQPKFAEDLSHLPVAVFNPRRDDFDKTLKQDISVPKFKEQVDWESKYLKMSTVIALYLQPGTVSPISLLELGHYAKSQKVIVCCPDGFGRKGNVQILCHDHGIPLIETYEEFVEIIKKEMEVLQD